MMTSQPRNVSSIEQAKQRSLSLDEWNSLMIMRPRTRRSPTKSLLYSQVSRAPGEML